MIKKIIIGILTFIVGIGISLFAESFFREQIQNIFRWTTSDRIMFVGKNFYLFSTNFYYLSFGITMLIFSLSNVKSEPKAILKNGILITLIFCLAIFGISAIDANIKVAECTACDDGIRKLHWNGIKYGLILGTSAMISMVPSLMKLVKNRTKASVQQKL